MINHWFITRPKRRLTSVPEILSEVITSLLGHEWGGERDTHLAFEEALEDSGLKRSGERRDQTGGGARTYIAWLKSLGLIFEDNHKLFLTLAGEALVNSQPPIPILTNQILKFQYPSSYSLSRGVKISSRFKIRPFRFLLKLLLEERLGFVLTEDEISKIVLTEAEDESDNCYNRIVDRLLKYREVGNYALPDNFVDSYLTSRVNNVSREKIYSRLLDTANTFANWLDYTQLISRFEGKLSIYEDKREFVYELLANNTPFIQRPDDEVYFQRRFGIDPLHTKDTRNLIDSVNVTEKMVLVHKINTAFISESLKHPICNITKELIGKIAEICGCAYGFAEEVLMKQHSDGAINSFLTNYYELAFGGTKTATEFEKATVSLFHEVFNFQTKHVGPIGLTPDVLLISDSCGFQAIIDNKAYSQYGISNDHHNRMVTNYIRGLNNYSSSSYPLAFFSYIAGGFVKNIDKQLINIKEETNIDGSAMPVRSMIKLIEQNKVKTVSHESIRYIFSCNHQISFKDVQDLTGICP